MQSVRREEYKYYIGLDHVEHIESCLASLMSLDPACNNNTGQYAVRSLYFDTPDSKDLNEKMDGIIDREKFRIRTYPGTVLENIFKLERKSKIDSVIEKNSLKISKENALNFQNGIYNELFNLNNDFANYCYKKLKSEGYRPVVIVEYDRKAFTLPYCNIRITIDKNLATGNGNRDITCSDYCNTPVFLDGMAILEVKFEKYLPSHIQDYLSRFNLRRCAISKFSLSQLNIAVNPWSDELIRPF